MIKKTVLKMYKEPNLFYSNSFNFNKYYLIALLPA